MAKLPYWKRRLLQVSQLRDQKDQEYIRKMSNEYDQLSRSINQEIDYWIERYAKNDNISKEAANAMLSKQEQKTWSMTLDEFRQKAITGGYHHQLNQEYFKSRVSRLEQLQRQLYFELAEMANSQETAMQAYLKDTLNETYLRQMYELTDRGVFSLAFDRYSSQALEIAIKNPWLGSNFSKRIWNNHLEVIPNRLSKVMSMSILHGWGIDRTVKEMMFGIDSVLKNRMITLVQTESAHLAEVANDKSMAETGVEKWEWLATLEAHTCKRCADLDGNEYELGDPDAPNCPDHPNCRCTRVPVIEGWESVSRWQRDPITGKGSIENDQSFENWAKDKRTPEVEQALKMERNYTSDKKQYERYKSLLGQELMPKTLDDFVQIKYNDSEGYEQLLRKTRLQRSLDKGQLSLQLHEGKQQRHELGHTNYQNYVNSNKNKGLPTPSYITLEMDKLQQVINENYLKGKVIERNSGQVSVEIEIDVSNHAVAFSTDGINSKPTNRFKIHISKNTTLMVPMYPKE